MHLSDLPAKIEIPFGNGAGGAYIRPIPVPSQIGSNPGAASFTDGFPPLTFTPVTGGGQFVNGEDINGILNHVTSWTRWVAAGGAVPFDPVFAAKIGGYPQYARVPSHVTPGVIWINAVDGNMTDPDGGSPVGWNTAGPVVATVPETIGVGGVFRNDVFVSPSDLVQIQGHIPDGETVCLPGNLCLKWKNLIVGPGGNVITTPFTWNTPFHGILSIVATGGGRPDSHWDAISCRIDSPDVNGGILVCDTAGGSSNPFSNAVTVRILALGNWQ